MRRVGLVGLFVTLAAPAASAQTAPGMPPAVPPPPAMAPANAPSAALVAHLTAWENKHKDLTNLYAKCDRVVKNTVLRKEKAYTGVIMCMKPNLAWMKIEAKDKPDDYQAYICDGQAVYAYSATEKTVTENKIPKSTPNSIGDNLLLEFMSGSLKAADAMKRFDLKLVKEEEHYVHIEVKAKEPKDLQEFETMLLVLYGPKVPNVSYLPAVVVMRKQSGQEEEQWTFKTPTPNHPGLTAKNFQYVPPPTGWTKVTAPPATMPPGGGTQPRVARP